MPQNIFDFAAANDAVLSHCPCQHLQNLFGAHPPTLNQADRYPQIAKHCLANPERRQRQVFARLRLLIDYCLRFSPASLSVQPLLFGFSFRRAVVLYAAFGGSPFTMRVFAPKWTAKVFAAGITRMGEEEDSAMPAACQTPPQAWFGPQHGPEHKIVLQHRITDFFTTAPVRFELKKSLDFYYQKPSVSLMMLIGICMASSYTIGTPCVER
jgi:hypothetical protein